MALHRHYQRMIPLLLFGELSEAEVRELEGHLATCALCRNEVEDTRKLHAFLARVPAPDPAEALLQDARLRSHYALLAERGKTNLWERFKATVSGPAMYRPAFGVTAAALLAVGFFGGRLLFPGTHAERDIDVASMDGEGVRVTNVRVAGATEGEGIELAFDTVTPMRLRGTIQNPAIQKVLAYALLNGENPGVRLRAVGSITANPIAPLEHEIKAALLLTLKSDPNDGVRKEALRALLRYPADREIRDVLMEVLLNDSNPGLRVAAINGLDSLRARGFQPDQQLLQTFRQRLQNDENQYVRVKSQSLFEEKIP